MKNTILILVLISFSFNFSYSQKRSLGNPQFGEGGFVLTTPKTINENIEGTPYISDEFEVAKISVSNSEVFKVKYNALLDEIEIENNIGEIYALNKYGRKDITITLLKSKKVYQIFSFIDDNNSLFNGFFVHITDINSKVKLLKKESKRFVGEKAATSGYDQPKPAHYRKLNDQFFIRIEGQNAIESPTKKKDFVKFFPNQSKEILSFIKIEKIKLKKEEDLLKLMKFINTI